MGAREIAPKVLVIEDDAAIAGGVVRGLRGAGFEVELARDGDRGAEMALGGPYDVIVLDLTLPGRDGLEVLELCRHRVSTPIIVLSARTSLSERLSVFEGGAVDYVPKPFFADELIARIRARLGLTGQRAAARVAWDDVVVDLDARAVAVAGERVALTSDELEIVTNAYTMSFYDFALSDHGFLRDQGHPIVICDHGSGHTAPSSISPHTVLRFFADHPLGVGASPWLAAPPAGGLDDCTLDLE